MCGCGCGVGVRVGVVCVCVGVVCVAASSCALSGSSVTDIVPVCKRPSTVMSVRKRPSTAVGPSPKRPSQVDGGHEVPAAQALLSSQTDWIYNAKVETVTLLNTQKLEGN